MGVQPVDEEFEDVRSVFWKVDEIVLSLFVGAIKSGIEEVGVVSQDVFVHDEFTLFCADFDVDGFLRSGDL